MIQIEAQLTPADLTAPIARLWELSAPKILSIEKTCTREDAAPVFTIDGKYTSRGWTEWTQGFQFGSAILQFDGTGDEQFLQIGGANTFERMTPHVTHIGVHDHGFNNVSTYGNLRRLLLEGRIARDERELAFYELALKTSGAVQASRWTPIHDGDGYIYSFNGPHSLFSDTIRSLRILALSHSLGHRLMGENDQVISLLDRLVRHARATAKYNVYYGWGRDTYDVRGRVAHESIFNTKDGQYRCASTQQGYCPFSTWTRGLAWILLGYAEQLEFLTTLGDEDLAPYGGRDTVVDMMLEAAVACGDFYIENSPTDGIPYWDTGAPGLAKLGNYLDRPADPFNDHEPVDSSAAAIAAQGFLRLGGYLSQRGDREAGQGYTQVGLRVLERLLQEPYLSTAPDHQGLLLHTVYHRPNGWDHVPEGAKIPHGESCMWGDYHLREAALYVQRLIRDEPYYSFFGPRKRT
jgi:hypothetical protein